MNLRSSFVLGSVIFVSCQSWAYLFTGLSIKVESYSDAKALSVRTFIELCKSDDMSKANAKTPCPGKIERMECQKLDDQKPGISSQWDCLTQENDPFRIVVSVSGKTMLASNSFVFAENRTSDRYAVHVQNGKTEILKVPRDLALNVGMTEMLENVFHPQVTKKIRELDQRGPGALQTIEKPETRLTLKVCQNEACRGGQQQEVSCSFETCGIRGMFYTCREVPGFARYAEFTLLGRDKVRRSGFFVLKDKLTAPYGLNYIHIKANTLEVDSGQPQTCQ